MDRQDILTQVRTSLNPVAMGRTRNRKAAAAAAAWPDIVKLLEMAGVSSATLQNIHPRETMDCMIARLRERGYLNGYKISIKSLLGREIPRKSKNPLSQYIVWFAGIFYDKPKTGKREFSGNTAARRSTTPHYPITSNERRINPLYVRNPPFPVILVGSREPDRDEVMCVMCDNRDDYTVIARGKGPIQVVEGCTHTTLRGFVEDKKWYWHARAGDYKNFDPLLYGNDTRILACAQALKQVMTEGGLPPHYQFDNRGEHVNNHLMTSTPWTANLGPRHNLDTLGLGKMTLKNIRLLQSFVGVFVGFPPKDVQNRGMDVGILFTSDASRIWLWIYEEEEGVFTPNRGGRGWELSHVWALPYKNHHT